MGKTYKDKKYKITKDVPNYALKRGMIFEWDTTENSYTTKRLPWYLTPMIDKEEMKGRVKSGLFKEI